MADNGQDGGGKQTDICPLCETEVGDDDKGLVCNLCDMWHHAKCEKMSDEVYKFLSDNEVSSVHWYCNKCNTVFSKMVKQITTISRRQDIMEKRMDAMEIAAGEQWIEVKEDMANLGMKMKDEIKKEVSFGLNEIKKDICKEIRDDIVETVENKMKTGKIELLDEMRGVACREITEEMVKTYKDALMVEGGAARPDGGDMKNDQTVVEIATRKVQSRMSRVNNIVLHRMPEEVIPEMDLTIREQKILHDKLVFIEFCNGIGITCYESEIEEIRRLGKYDGVEAGKARPILVTLKGNIKERIMRNLYKLQDSKSSYSDIFKKVGVTHDMTKEERKRDKELKDEADKKNSEEKEQGNYYVIRGSPWNRYLLKLRRKQ